MDAMDGIDEQGTSGGWRLLGLGDSSWCYNGSGVKFPTRLSQALAWYLVLRGGDVRRAEIVEHFWPDAKPEDGLNQLRVTLSRLKSMLAAFPNAPKLTTDRFIVRIDIGSTPCVALSYGALLDRVEASTGADKRAASLELVRLYGGDLLPEFDYPLFGQLRSFYQERNVHYLGCVSKDLKRTGDFATAVDILQRSLSIDPMQEDLYVMLFGIYAQMDRPLLIEKTVRNLIREMEAKLGDRPTERLEKTVLLALPPRLRDRMKATLNSPSEPASNVYVPPIGPYENSFVHRVSEFNDLHGHVTSGLSRCVAVLGPPGSGKTRLVYEYWLQHQTDFRMTWLDGSKVGSADELVAQLAACTARLASEESQALSRGIILFDACQVANPAWRTVIVDYLKQHTDISVIVTTRSADLPIGWANVPVMTLSAPVASMSDEACLETQAVKMLFSLMPSAVTSLSETTSTIAYIRTLFTYIDPLPFMIEVVASWLSAMTIQQLIVRLSKDRSTLLQAAADRSRDGVVFSDTIRSSVKLLSDDAKDVLRVLALYGEPLAKEKVIDVLDMRTDVAFNEVCDSGLVRILEDGKVVIWSLVGEFVRGTQPTSCRNVLISRRSRLPISNKLISFALPPILKDLKEGFVPTELPTVLSRASWYIDSDLKHQLKEMLLTFCTLDPSYALSKISGHDVIAVVLGLTKFRLLHEARILLTRYSDFLQDKQKLELQYLDCLLTTRQANTVSDGRIFDYIASDDPNRFNKIVSFALACVPSRPCVGFNLSVEYVEKFDIDTLNGSDLYGIRLIQSLNYEDAGQYSKCLDYLNKLIVDFPSEHFGYHNSYVAYHILRLQNRVQPTLINMTIPMLIPLSTVNEPGIVCGIASQLAFSFTDKRPETALHYLKISNSLYSTHLSNEKTSFATLNRRIELILRDSLGDDYIDAHLTGVDVSNVSIGDLCGPLDEYVRQTTLFAQG